MKSEERKFNENQKEIRVRKDEKWRDKVNSEG